jgi:hypothetical protein
MVVGPVVPAAQEIPMQMTQRRATAERKIPVGPADRRDRFTVRGAETVARLRQIVREGNVRRIWIKGEDGRTLIEIPSLLGCRGGHRMLPIWAAVGALASVSGQLTVEVKREAAWPSNAD